MALRQVYRGKVRGGIFQGFGWCTISEWRWVDTQIPELVKSTTQLGDRQAQVPVMPFLMATDPKIVKVYCAGKADGQISRVFRLVSRLSQGQAPVFRRVRPRRSISQPVISPSGPKRIDVVPFLSFSVPMSSC